MRILLCGPISLRLLQSRFRGKPFVPKGYDNALLAHLAEIYLDKGNHVSIVTSVGKLPDRIMLQGENLIVQITRRRGKYLFCLDEYRQEVLAMRDAITACSPDIVHAQWTYEFARAAQVTPFPHIVTARDFAPAIQHTYRTPFRLFRRWYASRVVPRIRNITYVSPYLKNAYENHYSFKPRSYLIPNGIRRSDFVATPKKYTTNQSPTLAMVTGMNRRKNAEVGIAAVSLLLATMPRARLIIAGKGTEDAQETARRLGVEANVECRGLLTQPDVMKMLRHEVDIFIHSSLEEAGSKAVAEAMANGLAIIGGANSGSVPWQLDCGRAGLLVNIQDPNAIAQGVISLCTNPEVASELAAKALERARANFVLEDTAEHYLSAYREVISEGQHTHAANQ